MIKLSNDDVNCLGCHSLIKRCIKKQALQLAQRLIKRPIKKEEAYIELVMHG